MLEDRVQTEPRVLESTTASTAPALPAGMEPFRERTRAPLRVPVRLKFDSFGEMQNGYTANVSRGGMFISASETRPVGTLLKFELLLSATSRPVMGLGEVVWIRLKQRDLTQPPGMGVQFRYLDVDSLAQLDVAVRRAIVELSVPEEPVEPSAGVTRRSNRLLQELEEALARCEDRGPALARKK